MSVALYRKYRPQNFSDVSDQNHIKITLQNEIETGRIGHAYLLTGPRGTGKTTLARLFAKAVNCQNLKPGGEPCNECDSCLDILAGKALDIIEIDAASHTGVDNVRDNIINNARFTPSTKKYKVFIIDEVHMLSISAFNALLKILEEPPEYIIFILATTEVYKVPQTIISRCQRFDFRKVGQNSLIERLRFIAIQENVKIDDKVLSNIAKLSGGCVRDAESLLEQVFSLGDNEITVEKADLILPRHDFVLYYDFLEICLDKRIKDGFELINKIVQEGFDVMKFIDHYTEFVRKILVFKITNQLEEFSRDIDESVAKKIIDNLDKFSIKSLKDNIEIFLKTKSIYKQSYLPQMALEMGLIELSEPKNSSAQVFSPVPQQPKQNISSTISAKVDKPKPAPTPFQAKPEVAKSDNTPKLEAEIVVEPIEVKPEPIQEVQPIGNVDFWPIVLQKAKTKNYGLFMAISMAKPVKVEGNLIRLAFLYELQKSKVEDQIVFSELRVIVEEVLGTKVELELTVDSNLNIAYNNNSVELESDINEIVDQFGGEIVEGIG